jgi:hypothetical protein
MSQHLSRGLLTRGVVGTLFTMIVVTTVLFVAAHHFAG